MIEIGPDKPEALGCGLHIDRCIVRGGLRGFQSALRNSAMLEKGFGTIELCFHKLLVLHSLAVVRVRGCDIRTSDFEQKLPLLDVVAQSRIDFDYTSGGKRGHRYLARNIRTDHSGHIQLRRGNILAGRGQRESLRMVHLEIVRVEVWFCNCGKRSDVTADRRCLGDSPAARRRRNCQKETHTFKKKRAIHQITSRPTAKFIWAAAVK